MIANLFTLFKQKQETLTVRDKNSGITQQLAVTEVRQKCISQLCGVEGRGRDTPLLQSVAAAPIVTAAKSATSAATTATAGATTGLTASRGLNKKVV